MGPLVTAYQGCWPMAAAVLLRAVRRRYCDGGKMRRIIGPMLIGFVGATVPAQNLFPPTLSTLSGRILSASGQPQIAEVQLYQSSSLDGSRVLRPTCDTDTDPGGSFTCEHLEVGEYFVEVHPRKQLASPVIAHASESNGVYFYPGVTDLSVAETVKVRQGETAFFDMRLKSTGLYSISGDLGAIPPTAVFRVVATDGTLALQTGIRVASSAEQKKFLARGLPPGHYLLSAEWLVNGARKLAEANVQISDRDAAHVVLVPKGFVRLEGSVSSPPGVQVAGVALYAVTDGYRLTAAVHDGHFTFSSVPPGIYYVGLPVNTGAYIDTMTLDNTEIPYSRMTLADGQESHSLLLTLKQTKTMVRGNLQGWSDDHPGIQMVLVSEDTGQAFSVPAKPDGTFTFLGVRPGNYSVFAWQRSADPLYRDRAFLSRHQSQGTSVSVDEGQAATADVDVLDQ